MQESSVVCLGEALALVPAPPGLAAGGAEPDPATAQLAGAEANVACGLAAAGVPAGWVGRLGTDRLGAALHAQLSTRGVETGGVQRDPTRPTGYYAKELDPDDPHRTRMHYRRAGSAASAMDPAFLELPAVAGRLAAARWVHTSGITAALSDSCAALMRALLGPDGHRRPVAFDVNWREQMWPHGDPAPVVELAGRADLVLVGADEARRVFGTDEPGALRRLLPHPRLLVIKDGDRQALAVGRGGEVVAEPALRVQVVESVGAGDAFAAGLLTGLVRGEPLPRCLRRGHLSAAAVLTVHADSAAPPTGARGDALLDAPAAEWAAIRVGPDGFSGPVAVGSVATGTPR